MLSELEDCLSCEEPTYEPEERREELNAVLTNFLRGLDPETEILFVRRYVYLETVSELAERFSLDENHISVKLYRARKMLKKLLAHTVVVKVNHQLVDQDLLLHGVNLLLDTKQETTRKLAASL